MRRLFTRFSAVLAGAVAVVSALLASGCNPDPTDPSLYNVVSFRNDTKQTVMLVACTSASCHEEAWRTELKPSRVVDEQVSNQGVRERFLVRSQSGRAVGCFTFDFRAKKQHPTRIAVSRAERC